MKIKSTFLKLGLIFSLWFLLVLGCANLTEEKISNEKGKSKVETKVTPKTESTDEDIEGKITRKEFGDDWAFTVDEGILSCKGENGIGEVTFTSGGKTYAINGAAKSNKEYLPIEDIWLDDPQWADKTEMKGVKKNIGLFIDKGLELCK